MRVTLSASRLGPADGHHLFPGQSAVDSQRKPQPHLWYRS